MQLIENSLAGLVPSLLVAIGLFGQLSLLRITSLSLVPAMAFGGYAAHLVLGAAGPNLLMVLAAGALAGAIVGLPSLTLDMALNSKDTALLLFGSTGFLFLAQGTLGFFAGFGVRSLALDFGAAQSYIPGIEGWIIIGIVAIMFAAPLVWFLSERTTWGKAAYALGDDRNLALLWGVPEVKVNIFIYLFGGSMLGIAGVLIASDGGLDPSIGFSESIKAFAVLSLAGPRLLLAGLSLVAVSAIEEAVGLHFSAYSEKTATYCTLVIFLLAATLGNRHSRTKKTVREAE